MGSRTADTAGLNRTFVELKQLEFLHARVFLLSLNRTFVELKQRWEYAVFY